MTRTIVARLAVNGGRHCAGRLECAAKVAQGAADARRRREIRRRQIVARSSSNGVASDCRGRHVGVR